jgi:2-oxoglutarate ferredoxin oxidoreductase subunit beta
LFEENTMAIETVPAVEPKPKAAPLTAKDYKGKVEPDWCPGCGDFGVLSALQTALAELGLQPHQVVTISGIGCSSNLPGYVNTYGMHTLHGRAVAVASGVQLANHTLKVICTGGDGDGYGIGGNHFIHCMRRNYDLTYLVMNNQIYGLTTGQCSPTSGKGMKTKSTPYGNVENPINPIALAIAGGATFVARGFSGNQKQLVELIKAGINHRGFALIDVFSPCVTYNKDNTYQWFRPRVKTLDELGHDPTDFHKAMDRARQWGEEIPIGLFWKRTDLPALDQLEPVLADGGPLAHRPLGIDAATAESLIRELM